MNFDPLSFGLDFRPPLVEKTTVVGAPAVLLNVIAEESIVEAIQTKSQAGLRIIRYLMSQMASHSLPDLNHPENIRLLARKFIQVAGNSRCAIEFMNAQLE